MSKSTTTEEAMEVMKEAYKQFGLHEDGTVKEGENPLKNMIKTNIVAKDKQEKQSLEEALVASMNQQEQEIYQDNKKKVEIKKETKNSPQQENNNHVQNEILKLQETINKLNIRLEDQEKLRKEEQYRSLEEQRKKAISKGDYEAVVALEQQKQQPVQQQNTDNFVHPAITKFLKKNTWYRGNSAEEKEMTQEADIYSQYMKSANIEPKEAMEYLENYIKEKFPKYFDINTESNEEPIVQIIENVNSGIVKKSKRLYTIDNLDDHAQHIASEIARLTKVSKKDYVDALTKEGLLKNE